MTYPNNTSPFGENRTPALIALSYVDNQTIVPLAADPSTGALLVNTNASSSSVNISEYGGTATSLGQKTMASSIPVTISSDQSAITVTTSTPTLPTTPLYGQTTIATTGTAVQLPSKTLTVGVIIQALAGNTADVYIGDSSVTTSNGFQLQPGQATSVAVGNVDDLYINGTAADGICFIGT